MGVIDVEGKKYFSNVKYFADLFNYLLYGGTPVIDPKKLTELDTDLIVTPYGNGAKVRVQKYRDLLRLWGAYMDETAAYVMLGAELQGTTNYAMPVKKGLYDMIGYANQVEEAKKSYQKKDEKNDSQEDNKTGKIKLTSAEFLSGFRKGDKLIPIITVTVLLSGDDWDGPEDLYGMLDIKDKRLLKFIPNCPINLIAPYRIPDSDFDKFNTDVGLVLKALKYEKVGADKILEELTYEQIDRKTVEFLNAVANLKLGLSEKEDQVDMFKSIQDHNTKMMVIAVIKYGRKRGDSDDVIIADAMEMFDVTREYVLELMKTEEA